MFLAPFWITFFMIFNVFRITFPRPFFDRFSSFPNRFLNRANHEIIKNPLGFHMLFCIRHFSHTINFSKIFNPKSHQFCIVFSCFFMTFLASIFASIFSSFFDGKWLPKWSGGFPVRRSFWILFRDLFRRLIFWCILVALWLTFGALLAPFWLPLTPFGFLLHPFWFPLPPLAHFGYLLAPF